MVALVNISQNNYPVFGFEHKLLVGNPYYIVILKQSFSLREDGTIKPLIKPIDIRLSDVVKHDSRWNSVKYPSDLIPYKPNAEIIVVGSAQQPTPKTEWLCDVRLDGLRENRWDTTYQSWHKSLVVSGERFWEGHGSRWQLTKPSHTRKVELGYENAYGGHFKLVKPDSPEIPTLDYSPNPSGTGWLPSHKDLAALTLEQYTIAQNHLAGLERIRVPQLIAISDTQQPQLPQSPYQPIPVAGFGSYANFWQPRMQYLSDKLDWSEEATGGGYPVDFDMRHWQQTSQDQWLPFHPIGGERLTLTGFFPEGKQSYTLPTSLAYLIVDDSEQLAMNLDMDIDTLVIDTDKRTLEIVWRRIVLLSEFGENVEIKVNAFVTDTKGYQETKAEPDNSEAKHG